LGGSLKTWAFRILSRRRSISSSAGVEVGSVAWNMEGGVLGLVVVDVVVVGAVAVGFGVVVTAALDRRFSMAEVAV